MRTIKVLFFIGIYTIEVLFLVIRMKLTNNPETLYKIDQRFDVIIKNIELL